MCKVLTTLYLCACAHMMFAQFDFSNPIFYNVSDGIPSNTIYSITQDDSGYIWIGTEGGVCSFDGSNFKVFGEEEDLLPYIVTKTIYDDKHRLWINTFGQLRYIEDQKVKFFYGIKSPNLNWSFNVANSDSNSIWLAMTNEIGLFDSETLEPKPFPNKSMQSSGRVKLLLGTKNDTVFVYENYQVFVMNSSSVLDSFRIEAIGEESFHNRVLWEFDYPNLLFNSQSGIVHFDLEKREERILDEGFKNTRDILYVDNTIYLTDREKGLWVIEVDDSYNFLSKTKVLDNIFINQIFLDKDGNLWLTTYGDGLILFREKRKQIAYSIPFENETHSNDLYSAEHDSEGKLWAGSFEGRLTCMFEEEQIEFTTENRYLKTLNRFLDLAFISDDSILIASDESLILFTDGKFKNLINGSFKSIHLFKDSVLVSSSAYTGIAKISELCAVNDTTIPSELLASKITILPVFSEGRSYSNLFEDGYFWSTSTRTGLSTNNPKYDTPEIKENFKKIKSNINDLVFLDEILIIVTNGQGIFLLKEDELFVINKSRGLSSNLCNDAEVVDDEIYIATNTGLNIINVLDWESKSFNIELVDAKDGLVSNEISDISIFGDELACATRQGLFKLSRKEISNRVTKFKPVLINEVTCNNIKLPVDSSYVLGPKQNNIQVKFNVIDFEKNNKVVFAYRMLGEQSAWQMTTSNEVNYNNLKSGEYEFQLGVVSPQNKVIEQRQNFSLKIDRPFTQSLWFKYLTAILLLMFLIFVFVYYSDQIQKDKLRTQVTAKTLEIEEKLNELEYANEQLENTNQELQSFTYVTSHDLKSPLRNIHAFVELLNKKNKDTFDKEDKQYISIVLSGAQRMSSIIDDLLMLSKFRAEVALVDVDLNLIFQEVLKNLGYFGKTDSLEIIKQNELPVVKFTNLKATQLFQNLIENGIKYNTSETKKISVESSDTPEYWVVSFSDNGIGIEKKHQESIFEIFKRLHADNEYSGTGIGLAICKRIMDSQNGHIEIESDKGQGSRFTVKIRK